MAALRGLLDAQRGNATPQETLAALMQLGDQELRPNEKRQPAAHAAAGGTQAIQADVIADATSLEMAAEAPVAEAEADESKPASITELDTAQLVELLESNDDTP